MLKPTNLNKAKPSATNYKGSTLFCFFLLLFLILNYPAYAQSYPPDVEAVLKKAGKNRAELEKSIAYFQKTGDSLKIKAIYFLTANMDIHFSINFYWADSLNQPVPFNELAYPNLSASLKAFDELKAKYKKLHPVKLVYYDIDSIKADFLIDNVERAFKVWQRPWAKHLSFADFCEFILPYRVDVEPLQNWHSVYEKKFGWVADSAGNNNDFTALKLLNNDMKKWFVDIYGIDAPRDPLPRLSPLQLLHRKQGVCEDMVGLGAYAMRSQGIPCATELIPYWATSSGTSFWNVTIDKNQKLWAFHATLENPDSFKILREPAKVIRYTYARQPGTIAGTLPDNQIPEGYMRFENIIDVTPNYWPVKDINYKLFPPSTPQKAVYGCVMNYLDWRPAFWGRVNGDSVVLKNMARGAVYLPMYYIDGKLVPAGYPVALGYNHEKTLIPDKIFPHTITLREQDKYLIYRDGKRYSLFYWDNDWQKLAEKKADLTHILTFNNVPRNALLIMVPEYSEGKERPFMITDEGERIWW
jgi:hypothetical protein